MSLPDERGWTLTGHGHVLVEITPPTARSATSATSSASPNAPSGIVADLEAEGSDRARDGRRTRYTVIMTVCSGTAPRRAPRRPLARPLASPGDTAPARRPDGLSAPAAPGHDDSAALTPPGPGSGRLRRRPAYARFMGVAFVAHCLLNQNSKVGDGAHCACVPPTPR